MLDGDLEKIIVLTIIIFAYFISYIFIFLTTIFAYFHIKYVYIFNDIFGTYLNSRVLAISVSWSWTSLLIRGLEAIKVQVKLALFCNFDDMSTVTQSF